MSDLETSITHALNRLIRVWPAADNKVCFEIEHFGDNGFSIPVFFAESNVIGRAMHNSPNKAVNKLFKMHGITTVEEYIRTKNY